MRNLPVKLLSTKLIFINKLALHKTFLSLVDVYNYTSIFFWKIYTNFLQTIEKWQVKLFSAEVIFIDWSKINPPFFYHWYIDQTKLKYYTTWFIYTIFGESSNHFKEIFSTEYFFIGWSMIKYISELLIYQVTK